MDITLITPYSLALVPVIVGLVQAIKMANYFADRYFPLISIGLGIGLSFIFPSISIGFTILVGIVIGLMASGLYSGVKTTVQG